MLLSASGNKKFVLFPTNVPNCPYHTGSIERGIRILTIFPPNTYKKKSKCFYTSLRVEPKGGFIYAELIECLYFKNNILFIVVKHFIRLL